VHPRPSLAAVASLRRSSPTSASRPRSGVVAPPISPSPNLTGPPARHPRAVPLVRPCHAGGAACLDAPDRPAVARPPPADRTVPQQAGPTWTRAARSPPRASSTIGARPSSVRTAAGRRRRRRPRRPAHAARRPGGPATSTSISSARPPYDPELAPARRRPAPPDRHARRGRRPARRLVRPDGARGSPSGSGGPHFRRPGGPAGRWRSSAEPQPAMLTDRQCPRCCVWRCARRSLPCADSVGRHPARPASGASVVMQLAPRLVLPATLARGRSGTSVRCGRRRPPRGFESSTSHLRPQAVTRPEEHRMSQPTVVLVHGAFAESPAGTASCRDCRPPAARPSPSPTRCAACPATPPP
jgi:hypothetical protein